jgi:hypothetical protein
VPRIRSIKPQFFTSEAVADLPVRARLTWIGLWTHCDDHGRCLHNVKLIRAAVYPLDDFTVEEISQDVAALVDSGRLQPYSVDGREYLQVTNWREHQKVDHPTKSNIPAPLEPSRESREPVAKPRVRRGGEEEGIGGGSISRAPANRCPKHIDDRDAPPCRACGDARRAYDAWTRGERERPTTTGLPPTADSPRCDVAGHETELATHCRICASERKSA